MLDSLITSKTRLRLLIKFFLIRIRFLDFFSSIIGNESFYTYSNKISIKADYLFDNHHKLDPYNILIIDDSSKQLENIRNKCNWIKIYKVNSLMGITYTDMINIKNILKNKNLKKK